MRKRSPVYKCASGVKVTRERESRNEEASYQCSSREGGEGRESELTMVVNQWRLSVREA